MRAFWTIVRKELLDAARDRRMVLVAFLVMPLAVPAVLAGTSALGLKKQAAQLQATLAVPVIGAEHAPRLMAWLDAQNLRVVAAPANPDAAVRSQRYDVILRVDREFGADWRARQARASRTHLRQFAAPGLRHHDCACARVARCL